MTYEVLDICTGCGEWNVVAADGACPACVEASRREERAALSAPTAD